MDRMFDNKEIYLYGTFFALVKEQLGAIDRAADGRLGWWGKGRVNARNQAMGKFVKKILKYKLSKGSADPMAEFLHDLEFIEHDNRVWGDIESRQLEYVRDVIGFL